MTLGQKNARRIWAALPGTSKELASRSGLSVTTIQRYLRAWQNEGLVSRHTHWLGFLAHTLIYRKVKE